jgi:transposase InsO family protein
MHKHTKLTPALRKEVYRRWCHERLSFRKLGRAYHVDKNVVAKAVLRGRLNDFSVHDSANRRYRTVERGLVRLAATEARIAARLARLGRRYERAVPGELVHADTKRLPLWEGERRGGQHRREVIFILIDDCTRWLFADILPDMTQWSAATFTSAALKRLPFGMECHYSDNGAEYRGTARHALVSFLAKKRIVQKFTKIRHPWTNGKAERAVRTVMSEWFRKNRFATKDERRRSLYHFVDWYNHERKHMGIGNRTPAQKLKSLTEGGDNA